MRDGRRLSVRVGKENSGDHRRIYLGSGSPSGSDYLPGSQVIYASLTFVKGAGDADDTGSAGQEATAHM